MERNLEQVQVPVYEKDFSWLEKNLPFFSHLTIGAYQFSFDSEEIIRERPLWPLRSLIRGMNYSSAEKFISISQHDLAASAESGK